MIGDLEELLTHYRARGVQASEGETLFQLGLAQYWAHRLARSADYLDQALAIADAIGHVALRARALRVRAILQATHGQLHPGTAAPASSDDDLSTRSAEELWGYAMLAHVREDEPAAQRYAQACIDAETASANTFLRLGGSFVLGMAQANLGAYQAALDTLGDALRLAETTSDRFWRARLLNTLGWVYQEVFSLEQALAYHQASLEAARVGEPRLTEVEGYALVNLATTRLLLGQVDAARADLVAGLDLAAHETFMRWRYYTRLVVVQGQLAVADGELARAAELAEQAAALADTHVSKKNRARALLLRGQILVLEHEREPARRAFREALDIARHLHWLGMMLACQIALAEVVPTSHQPHDAHGDGRDAQALIRHIAGQLVDPALRAQWLAAPMVRTVMPG